MSSPTSRSLNWLRDRGYATAVVEKWVPGANIRKDLFGCIDILGIKAGEPVIGVQATSFDNVSARVKKAQASQELHIWLATGHTKFVVMGWGRDAFGKWMPKVVELSAGDMKPTIIENIPPKRRRAVYHPGDLYASFQKGEV